MRIGVVNGAAVCLHPTVAIVVTGAPNVTVLALDVRAVVVRVTLSFRAEIIGIVAVAPGRAMLTHGVIIEGVSGGRPGPTGTIIRTKMLEYVHKSLKSGKKRTDRG